MKPTIMLVGHGAVSGQKCTINYGNYSIILPIPTKELFSLTSHNMIVKRLTDAANAEIMGQELDFLASLPTTRVVSAVHKKPILLTFGEKDISSKDIRTVIQKQLLEAEEEAVSSQSAWEIFEYNISVADDILTSKFSFLPDTLKFNFWPLMYNEFTNSGVTLNIYLNTKLILSQVESFAEGTQIDVLSEDNFIYMTPTKLDTASTTSVLLSGVLHAIKEMRILVARWNVDEGESAADDEQEATLPSAKKAKLGGSCIEMVFMEEFRTHELFSAHKQEVEAKHLNTLWYELFLPDDSNVIIGACGDEDLSF